MNIQPVCISTANQIRSLVQRVQPEQIATKFARYVAALMTAVLRHDVLHERIMRGVRSKGGISARLFHETIRLGPGNDSPGAICCHMNLF
ncbi:MAG: hypothetical protein CM15mP46_3140 [Alphaproteobacteria bacterium]|nr:MAG: hypothetical protein CM15mP46_3140 [Alphaproteobacteria bacterium]